uniref:Myosin VI cargo binding domain-containing protein n=1 Tax=Ditylenchus dipsaci TaxID=166011 RepID=A0A915CRN2_9BILA
MNCSLKISIITASNRNIGVNIKEHTSIMKRDDRSKVDLNGWRDTHPGLASMNRPSPATSLQRYFRVPFEKPIGTTDYSTNRALPVDSTGFWYAHFDGSYIARQMELHGRKPALLLLAGRDDEKMCELSLEETRLTHKKGAEILAVDFETLWSRHSGLPYKNNN